MTLTSQRKGHDHLQQTRALHMQACTTPDNAKSAYPTATKLYSLTASKNQNPYLTTGSFIKLVL